MGLTNVTGQHRRSRWQRWMPLMVSMSLAIGVAEQGAIAQSTPPVEECNQFADVVNQNAAIMAAFEEEIANFTQNASQAETLADIKSVARQYVDAVDVVIDNLDGMIDDLEGLSLTDDQLVTRRDEYATVVAGFNEALTLVTEAMTGVAETETETELVERIEVVQVDTIAAAEQIEQLAIEEADIIQDVNTYCGVE